MLKETGEIILLQQEEIRELIKFTKVVADAVSNINQQLIIMSKCIDRLEQKQ
jgi:hypothetical protein